jgi:flagellar biosynthesis protein
VISNKAASQQRRATALGYNGIEAPRVLAAGTGDVAAAIERLAAENHIPVIQDPGLSALLAVVPLGEEIPPQLYVAVATVLSYVFRVSGRNPEDVVSQAAD